jgi:phospholipid transport system substrate-binding protein
MRFYKLTLCLAVMVLQSAVSAGRTPAAADIEQACARIRETSEKGRRILEDPALAGREHESERLAKVSEALAERFDWPTISRWVLGRNARKFDEEHLREFTDLFRRYVVLYYMAKVEDYIGGGAGKPDVDKVKILYGKGRARRDGAVVAGVTFNLPDRKEIHTLYTLVRDKKTGDWKVRNFVVEGVSLVRNWRTELSYIGRRDKILSLLRKKVADLEKQRLEPVEKTKKEE